MIKSFAKWLLDFSERYVLVRYLISGGTSTVTDLLFLYIFYKYFGIHYLISAVMAFLVAFSVSFTLHKYWTFKSHGDETRKQVVMYFSLSILGLSLNTLLMYIMVDFFSINVMVAQLLTAGMVAMCTFFISRRFVFKYKK